MKALVKFLLIVCAYILLPDDTHAQLLKKIRDRAAQTAENKVLNKTEDATNKTMDGKVGKNDNASKSETEDPGQENSNANEPDAAPVNKNEPGESNLRSFANYDFVPGDKIIFFYDMAGERDAEIPGRMLVNDGNVEVQSYQGEKVLLVPKEANLSMIPAMKNGNYLPEQYTLEFDVLANGGGGESSSIEMYFRKPEHADAAWSGHANYWIRLHGISAPGASVDFTINKAEGGSAGGYRAFAEEAIRDKKDNWRRIALYVNKNIGKLYVDQHRVAIVNRIEPGAGMVTFEIRNESHPVLIKNIRIAAGGSDAYNKVLSDGKFIAYGIQFDVNKAVLKPESMGTLNEIARMLREKPELKFEVGGHTDSDGSAEANNKLSLARAEAVKTQLVAMGISADRLTTKGYGAAKPVTDNNNPENKAKNRRVEFVKL